MANMLYIIVFILLISLIILYFKIADKYNIVDRPNERSSHSEITLRGGGIIFWFAALFYFILNIKTSYPFFTAITFISFISFYDDIKTLPNKLRAFIQFISMSVIFYDLNIFHIYPWWLIPVIYIFSIGIINAYNFMDGINGITGLYTLVVFSSFLYVNTYIMSFTDNDFLLFPIIACLVFLFFNYRKKAKCFAGDIGSISIAFWVIYVMLKLIIETNSIVWLLFLAVYGTDTICTILHRLYLRQNIFKAHRLHLYQILSNEYKLDHRIVSLFYSLIQGFISYIIIVSYNKLNLISILLMILLPLSAIYCIKFSLMKRFNQ